MIEVEITLGAQNIKCQLQLEDDIYSGVLPGVIIDKKALEFWLDYEEAVNGFMLQQVDMLEKKMTNYNFSILLKEERFLASDLDLQIYPSTLAVSFKQPQEK